MFKLFINISNLLEQTYVFKINVMAELTTS